MIGLTLPKIDSTELENYISEIPEVWRKFRGRIKWGMDLVQSESFTHDTGELKITTVEWDFTGGRSWGYPTLVALFVFEGQSDRFEVFFSCPKALELKMKQTFLRAYEIFKDPYEDARNV